MHLDKYDRAIIGALQKDGRTSNVQLAATVNLSESACLRRVRALEDEGMIDRYVALVNQSMAGLGGNVLVHIGLHREEQSVLEAFETAVRDIPEVMECYLMTGEFDYLLRVVVADMADFERLHKEALTRLPGVARVNSSVAIRTVQKKDRAAAPLGRYLAPLFKRLEHLRCFTQMSQMIQTFEKWCQVPEYGLTLFL